MRLRFPQPGSRLDYAAIPFGAALLIVAALLVARPAELLPGRVAHWWRCGGSLEGAPSWSPDGSHVAFARRGACGTQIVVVDARGRSPLLVTHGRNDSFPRWSPDGRELLYSADNGLTVLARGRARVIDGYSSDFGGTWSPDGRKIAYTHGSFASAGGDLQTSVYVMRADGSHRRRVLEHGIEAGTAAWSPTGAELAVAGYDGVYVMRSDGRFRRRIANEGFGFNPAAPAWSPDGKTIVYVGAAADLYTVGRDGSHRRKLADCDCAAYTDAAAWSPNGQRIAYSVSDGSKNGIYVVGANGRGRHRIVAY